jgi:phosphomethylpyrimidine synthase
MTQLEIARRGDLSPEVRAVAESESIDAEVLRAGLAAGTIVLPVNASRRCARPTPIGAGLRIKVNANIGASTQDADADHVIARLHTALEAGADAIMDLSTAGDLDAIRRAVLAGSPVSVGTVPVYQAAVETATRGEGVAAISEDGLFGVIEQHAKDGVDFITVHCGVTQETAQFALNGSRLTGVVSRGGAFTICWMRANARENPLYARFDDLLAICREHDVTLSLGDGLRPGCLADGSDRAQFEETAVLGDLVLRAREAGVSLSIKSPPTSCCRSASATTLLSTCWGRSSRT